MCCLQKKSCKCLCLKRSPTSKLTLHVKKLENEEQFKSMIKLLSEVEIERNRGVQLDKKKSTKKKLEPYISDHINGDILEIFLIKPSIERMSSLTPHFQDCTGSPS